MIVHLFEGARRKNCRQIGWIFPIQYREHENAWVVSTIRQDVRYASVTGDDLLGYNIGRYRSFPTANPHP